MPFPEITVFIILKLSCCQKKYFSSFYMSILAAGIFPPLAFWWRSWLSVQTNVLLCFFLNNRKIFVCFCFCFSEKCIIILLTHTCIFSSSQTSEANLPSSAPSLPMVPLSMVSVTAGQPWSEIDNEKSQKWVNYKFWVG